MSETAPSSKPEPAPEETGTVLSAAQVKRRALLGGIALGARTVATQLIVLGGQVVLARRLTPKQFGAFAIVQFALTFFTLFGDAGLGGALIQRKTAASQRELSSVFWAQTALGTAVLAVVALSAGLLPLVYPDLPPESSWLLRLIAVGFLATSLRVIPSILMERELQFVRLSVLDTVNNIAFYLTASILAVLGAGIWSLAAGVVCQGVVTLLLAFVLRPWRPTLVFDRAALRPLLNFGIPFQLKSVVGLALSAILPVYGGRVLGARPVGLLNWAQSTAYFPLRLVEIVSRVSFPMYSRLASDPQELRLAIERAVRLTAFASLFFCGLLLGLGLPITRIVYSDQWLEALPLLYAFTAAMGFGFLAPVVATAFDALGDPRTILRLSVVYTLGTWITVPPATKLFGQLGFAVAYVFWVVFGNLATVVLLRRKIPQARVLRQLRGPLLGACASACLGHWLLTPHTHGIPTLILSILASTVAFVAVASVVDPTPARDLWTLIRKRKPHVPPSPKQLNPS